MKEKLEKAFAEAWSTYQSHQSGYRPGFFTEWRHRSTSSKKEQLKTDFEIALANADTDSAHMEKLLAARLRDGSFNNGSFNNILINALQKNGIKEIDGQDLNDYRPPEKRIVKEQENIQLYRFDSRTLEKIQADGGFKPQQHSDFYDDILNLKNGSVGVSFTTDKQVAVAYMLKHVKKGLTDGALYTVKLSAEEAAMTFSLSKTAKARGDSDLWLHLKKGTVPVTEENGEKSRRSKGEVNIVPTLGAIAVSDKSIIAVEPTEAYLQAHPKLQLKSSNGSKSSSEHFRKKLADGKLNPQPSSLSQAQKEDDYEDKKTPPSASR